MALPADKAACFGTVGKQEWVEAILKNVSRCGFQSGNKIRAVVGQGDFRLANKTCKANARRFIAETSRKGKRRWKECENYRS